MTCRNCKLYNLDETRDKAGRVRKDRIAPCMWVSTEPWPMSTDKFHNHRPKVDWMAPDDGEECQCFIEREKK